MAHSRNTNRGTWYNSSGVSHRKIVIVRSHNSVLGLWPSGSYSCLWLKAHLKLLPLESLPGWLWVLVNPIWPSAVLPFFQLSAFAFPKASLNPMATLTHFQYFCELCIIVWSVRCDLSVRDISNQDWNEVKEFVFAVVVTAKWNQECQQNRWNWYSLWIDGCSRNSDIVERHRHVWSVLLMLFAHIKNHECLSILLPNRK